MERAYSPRLSFPTASPGASPRADMVRAFGASVRSFFESGSIVGTIGGGLKARSMSAGRIAPGVEPTIVRGLKARSIPAWRIAPSVEPAMVPRAEGPINVGLAHRAGCGTEDSLRAEGPINVGLAHRAGCGTDDSPEG